MQMFHEMRAETPDLKMPPMAQVREAYEGVRHRMLGLGIARDIGFRMPSVWIAEGHSKVAPVWLYRFDYSTPFLRLLGLGATHASELPYLWGNLDGGPKDPTFRLGGHRVAQRISPRMQARWRAFARGDVPDAPESASWPQYEPESRSALVIDAEDRCQADLDAGLRAGWGEVVLSFH